MSAHQSKRQAGFTLIELLIVIAIIAALAVSVYVALNPTKRLQDSHDARRTADVDTILTAMHSYIVDNKGALPAGLSKGMAEVQLGTATSGCGSVTTGGCNVAATSSACLDLSTPLAPYLKTIPVDPKLPSSSSTTDYSVVVDNNSIITVKACGTEGTTPISASR